MITISKIRNLINRNVKITLANTGKKEVYFTGYAKDIPKTYDAWTVNDIIEYSSFDCMIEIEKKEK